uniref:hypothetical protein n=1 Tax=Nocardia farcinica TaxID=37329 RepID=UPI00245580C2
MYILLTWAPPVAVAALVVALYNTYLKRREEAIQGWLFTTSRAPWIDDGHWKTVSVKIRVIGAVAAYEVETHVWNTTSCACTTHTERPTRRFVGIGTSTRGRLLIRGDYTELPAALRRQSPDP